MALATPLTVTVGTAQSLPRIVTNPMSATYRNADGSITLDVSHRVTRAKRVITRFAIVKKKISTNPLSDMKSHITAQVAVTFDRDEIGWTETELLELMSGTFGGLTATTNAVAKQVLGLES